MSQTRAVMDGDEWAGRIRAARGYAGMAVREFAEATRIPVRRLRDLEAGRRQPEKAEVAAVAAACHLPLAMLTAEWRALGSATGALAIIAGRMSALEDRLARIEALLSLPGRGEAPRRR
jgi:transcriptional regulator with XRE-family HTH domain